MSSVVDVLGVPVTLELYGKTYKLGLIDFFFQAWAMHEFATVDEPNGMKALEGNFRNCLQPGQAIDFLPIVKTVWHLLQDKKAFPDLKTFVNSFKSQEEILGVCLPALVEVFTASYPEFTESEKEKLKKKKNSTISKASGGWLRRMVGRQKK